jgi:hypothetical protein
MIWISCLGNEGALFNKASWIANGALGFGISLSLFAASSNVWLSALLLVVVGYTMMIQMASSNILIQSMVSDAYSLIFDSQNRGLFNKALQRGEPDHMPNGQVPSFHRKITAPELAQLRLCLS